MLNITKSNARKNHLARSHAPCQPCAQSRVWWSVQPGDGRSHSTAPRGPFPHVPGRAGRAWCQTSLPTLLVSHTTVRTPRPCSHLYAGCLHTDLAFGPPEGFPLDTADVHNHLKQIRSEVSFLSVHFYLFFNLHSYLSEACHLLLICNWKEIHRLFPKLSVFSLFSKEPPVFLFQILPHLPHLVFARFTTWFGDSFFCAFECQPFSS